MDDYMAIRQAARETAGHELCLFRVGDFLEADGGDAKTIRDELGLRLGLRNGFAYVAWPASNETYIAELVKLGYRVAILEPVAEAPIGKAVQKVLW